VNDHDNPWVMGGDANPRSAQIPQSAPEKFRAYVNRPRASVGAVDKTDQLPRRKVTAAAGLWFVGVHGGAGESTLAQLVQGSAAADHFWPIATNSASVVVVLVCRSNMAGLRAAQRAVQDWASGALPTIQLCGLVIVADAKGSLPKPLRDLVQVLSGAVPRTWSMPWLDALRLGQGLDLPGAPRAIHSMVASIAAASSSN
jgi:hypothetical protein